MKVCLLVPHYNHLDQFERFLPRLMETGLPLIVIDDGSEVVQRAGLEKILQSSAEHHLVSHSNNQGKGAAFFTGLGKARSLGFSHVIQIDADGQHDVKSIGKMLALAAEQEDAIVSGLPVFDSSIPAVRLWGRKITLYLSRLEAMSADIEDAMCGFRVYPVEEISALYEAHAIGKGMDFDADILVKAAWFGLPLLYVPTPVIYQQNGVSHFHYLSDNLVMIGLHIRLLLGALLRMPQWLRRRFARSIAS